MVGTDNRLLEEGPRALDGVGVEVAAHVLSRRVVDALVRSPALAQVPVGLALVGVDAGGGVSDLGGELAERPARMPLRAEVEASPAAPSDGPAGDGLVHPPPTASAPPIAAYVGLVHFHDPLEGRGCGVLHGLADAVEEIPRGLVAHSDGALDLVRTDAILGFDHHVGGQKPPSERQMAALKDRARCDTEVV